jgi:hypothetical protein
LWQRQRAAGGSGICQKTCYSKLNRFEDIRC